MSERSVDDLFADWKIQTGPKLFLVLVGEGPFSKSAFEQDDWERSVWNDPEFAAFLSEQDIPAVYMSGKENAAFYSTLDISSLPRVLLYQGSLLRSSRAGLAAASDTSRTSMIEWIKQVQTGITPVEAAYLAVDEDPENAMLRMKLMDELWKERRETEYLEQLCWLIDHNEQYKHALMERSAELNENEFRYNLLYQILSLRDNLVLSSDGWTRAMARVESAQRDPRKRMRHHREQRDEQYKFLVNLRRSLESRIEDNAESDRDRFILQALTAEGDEQQSLIEQYSAYSP
ncbi:MAG: hypothetical protein ACX94C_13610 [Phycisphaerales bacterium]